MIRVRGTLGLFQVLLLAGVTATPEGPPRADEAGLASREESQGGRHVE